jgi:putative ABC transport system ATP-binding protein
VGRGDDPLAASAAFVAVGLTARVHALAAPATHNTHNTYIERDTNMAFTASKANVQREAYQTPGAPLVQVEQLMRVVESRIQKITILDDISFVVPAQSLFAINGPSGSGKSTLLNMLTGIDRPSSGRIVFGGEELRAKSENALARWRGRHVGIVFQFFQLLPTLTAEENILLALELGGLIPRRQWRARTANVLALVGLSEYARRLPSALSGGQQQRVAIARALANDPPVLVADEPTGNLDSKTAAQVFTLLEDLTRQGKTVIYVTHDPRLAARASHRIELLDGRIVGQSDWSDQRDQPLAVGAHVGATTGATTGELEVAR